MSYDAGTKHPREVHIRTGQVGYCPMEAMRAFADCLGGDKRKVVGRIEFNHQG